MECIYQNSLGETSSLLGELQELWPAAFTGHFLEWIVYVVHRNELPSGGGSVFCVFCIVHPYLSLLHRGCIMFKGKIIEVLDSKIVLG